MNNKCSTNYRLYSILVSCVVLFTIQANDHNVTFALIHFNNIMRGRKPLIVDSHMLGIVEPQYVLIWTPV